jgi:trk system potassium uptake protein TrkH
MSEGRSSRIAGIIRAIDRLAVGVAVLAVLTLLVDIGWAPTLSGEMRRLVLAINGFVVCLFLFEYFAKLFLSASVARHIRANPFDAIITLAFLVMLFSVEPASRSEGFGAFLRDHRLSPASIYPGLGLLYIALTLISKAAVYQKQLSTSKFQPAGIVAASFILVIALGTALLSSPQALSVDALAREGRCPLIDSLFTATSAVCVTGLVVKDTGAYFSTFGQAVIMCLIQVGGLGLMTFVAFSSLLIGKGIALSERMVMRDVLSYEVMNRLPRMIVLILLVTFGTEALGAVMMYGAWQGDYTSGQRLYLSVFHAVSAYCNAGFSLMSDNLMGYRGSITVVGTITGLIIFGGIGFAVQGELLDRLSYILKPRAKFRGRLLKNLAAVRGPSRISLHTKVVLITTGLLLFWGAVLFGMCEWSGVLSGESLKTKVLASWFQGVTPRTAGFSTVDLSMLRLPTLLLLMALMFIGASPGGTGGGIKTSTFAVVIATMRATLHNRVNVEMLKRSIPIQTIRQSLAVLFLAMSLVIVATAVLSVSDRGVPLEYLLFEEVSAFGTVGLSTGTPWTALSLSASLSVVGKLVIMISMLLGRIGSLVLLMVISQKSTAFVYEYSSERVTVG